MLGGFGGCEQNSSVDQLLGFLAAHPEDFVADFAGVLPGQWRRPLRCLRDVPKRRRAGLSRQRVIEQRMTHVAEQLSLPQLRVFQHIGRTVHLTGRDAGCLQCLGGLRRGPRAGPRRRLLEQIPPVRQSRLAGREPRIVAQLG